MSYDPCEHGQDPHGCPDCRRMAGPRQRQPHRIPAGTGAVRTFNVLFVENKPGGVFLPVPPSQLPPPKP